MSQPGAEHEELTGSGPESSRPTHWAGDVEDAARERDEPAGPADPAGHPEKPTAQWVTGDEPATGPQESYLGTLAQEAGEAPKSGLTKAEASEEIDRLQQETGRGT